MTDVTRRFLALLATLTALLAVPAEPAQAAIPAVSGQSTFVPQAPLRVLDTRIGTGGHIGLVGAGQSITLSVPGRPAGATAVVLNVTATASSGTTVIAVYPAGALPAASNLNVVRGRTAANLVVSRLGTAGDVSLRNNSGSVHLIADLAGFYVAGGSGAGFFGTAPTRLLDTRSTVPLQAGQPRTLPVRFTATGAASGVPMDASAVVLNVTAVKPNTNTVLRVYPGGTPPTVSNLNPSRGQIVANLVVVRVDDVADAVQLLNGAGATHVVVDLAGWYVPGSGDVFHPVTPFRALDTRSGAAVAASQPRGLGLAGATSLPWVATALALNVTAVRPTGDTFVTVYPLQSEAPNPPTASTLNLLRDEVLPNAAVVAVGEGGAVRLSNNAGSVHLVVDVAGWFGPAGDGWDISWPQCTSAGSTTSNHPTGGAFSVIGVTRGVFTANTCLADEWAWASTLRGEPSAYLNVDANVENPHWADAGPKPVSCAAKQQTSDCGFNYGWNLARFAETRIPTSPQGGKPFVWLDVEGPYASGPFWANVATNRSVVSAAVQRLRSVGFRVGIYSDRATSTSPDWSNIMGAYVRTDVQNWVFRAPDANAHALCTPATSFSGGPVVMVQVQPGQSGETYDVNHTC